jgi:phage anti-repressor protein
MIKTLNESFTEKEHQWYIAQLYMYLHYHSTNDYPINLENVFKMIGFSHKANAKRTLLNNFVLDQDYIIILPKQEKQNSTVNLSEIKAAHPYGGAGSSYNKLGEEKLKTKKSKSPIKDENKKLKNIGGSGLNEEIIMLNTDTFKNLCMLVKTPEGKEMRKYYVKLENINNKIIKEEIENKDKLLIEQKLLLEEKQIELERTQIELIKKTKLKVKKWYEQEPGNVIYGYKSNNENDNEKGLITIGKSINIKNRESSYMTHNQNGDMFYIRKCHNCDLSEKVIHHILDKYREERNKEWFEISEELTTRGEQARVRLRSLKNN